MNEKQKYCFLVMCNPVNPLVYAVYSNQKSAVQYAKKLIDWRFDSALCKGQEHGYYHYFDDSIKKTKETDFDKNEKVIFSSCLKIKDGGKDWSDDGCIVKVVRKPLLNKYK